MVGVRFVYSQGMPVYDPTVLRYLLAKQRNHMPRLINYPVRTV
jgi:hypothetical protein